VAAWSNAPSVTEPTDRDLMMRLGAGDREALAPLMERHHRRLYRVALAYLRRPDDALDVVQETFVKAYTHAAHWDGRSEVVPWLTRIAVNQAIDVYRRARRRRDREEPLDEAPARGLAVDSPSPERHLLGREIGERVGAALGALPERQRAVFVLRHYEDLSLDEIAQSLGMSLGTVKSSLHRAVHRLRQRLQGVRA
jgi:RNA polymerase sigma factor (sigma-70 family)